LLFNSNFRKKSFYITEEKANLITQKEILPILQKISFPCILSFTQSNKKHRLFRSKISQTREELFIILDDDILEFNLDQDLPVIEELDNIYKNNKISKEWIIQGNMPVNAIKKY